MSLFLSHGDVGTGAALTVHQPFILQVAHSTGYCCTRCGKRLGKLSLGRQTVPRLKETCRDIAQNRFENLSMSRPANFGHVGQSVSISGCFWGLRTHFLDR